MSIKSHLMYSYIEAAAHLSNVITNDNASSFFIMACNKIIRNAVVADVSRTSPIHRPSLDVMMSALKVYVQ